MDSDVDYYYGDALRWSFGFDNPNKAAVLFACLFPLVWLLWSLVWKIKSPWLRWPGVLFASGLVLADAYCLFMTYSRGGVVAALAGAFYLLGKSIRIDGAWLKSIRIAKLCGAIALGSVLIALFLWVGLGNRSVEPLTGSDASVSHRLILWRSALEMAVDNPLGFGTGHSGEAYMQWYQPLHMSASYRTMVNSYLTFLVEQGWMWFMAALLAFTSFWFWTSPEKTNSFRFGAMTALRGAILAFLVAGIFSTVMEEPLLWIIPAICTLILAGWSFSFRNSFGKAKALKVSAVSLVILLALYGGGIFQSFLDPLSRTYARANDEVAMVNLHTKKVANKGKTWVIMLDAKVLGAYYGKLLRQLVEETGITLVFKQPSDLHGTIDNLLLVGDSVSASPFPCASRILLLAPGMTSTDQAAHWLESSPQVSLLLPTVDDDGRVSFWEDCVSSTNPKGLSVQRLDGVGLRIDWEWPEVIQAIKGSAAK